MFTHVFEQSMVARALKQEKLTITIHNIRNWSTNNYQSVDDHPFGGGAGMVMMIEPLDKALTEIKAKLQGDTKIVVTSASGDPYNQQQAQVFSKLDNLIIICGHYEGIDQRVCDYLCDAEVSIGNYVLSGGEIASMVIVDTIARLLPGVLGNQESLKEESFNDGSTKEYPQYTRPAIYKTVAGQELAVPDILLNGNHAAIAKWRADNRK
jgi:tRNA (guanine37-N1)-methyltransferase